MRRLDDGLKAIVQGLASADPLVRQLAREDFSKAIREPIRSAVFDCDVASNIFMAEETDGMSDPRYQLDIIQPGTERDFTAYVVPECAAMPRNFVQSDYLQVPTYLVGNTMEWCEEHARKSRYNMFTQVVKYFKRGFVKKLNDDAWRLLLAAAIDRNMIVYDDNAQPGQFTKRLISLSKLAMKRNNGGNMGCDEAARLTDLYVSLEAQEDILNWGLDQVDDNTRQTIFNTCDGLTSIFCVNLHPMTEFGVGQEYQLMYENELSGVLPGPTNTTPALAAAKREVAVGLSLNGENDAFVMPVERELEMRQYECVEEGVQGIRGTQSYGLAVLDARATILLSF